MKHHKGPIGNLGHFAHPPKTNVNHGQPTKAQVRTETPKLMAKSGDKGGKSKHPGMR